MCFRKRVVSLVREVEAKDVVRTFNDRFTLDCSFKIRAGKTYVLMGPNGSGKSTLLKIMALLEMPDRGTIIYRAEKEYINPFSELGLRRRVVLVSTNPVVFRERVIDNVTYGLRLRGFKKAEAEGKALEALERVGLVHLKDEKATVLSSGERQRLSLARALAIGPDVLLLDEPTVNLDPENTETIERTISSLPNKTERIILFVTHNIFQARRLSDEVVFMYNGRILEQKPKEEFFSSPSTELARKFIEGEIY
jgi:tungstate transport system ATP-binding protein